MDTTTFILISTVLGTVVSIFSLWFVGRWRVGGERAKFTDAIWISVVSTVASSAINYVLGGGIIGTVLQIGIGLVLVMKYYETDLVNAAIISIVAGILSAIVISVVAVALGVGGGLF